MTRSLGRLLAVSAMVIVAPALVARGSDSDKAGTVAMGLPAPPAFIPLGQLPGSTSGSRAVRISPDGQVVIGTGISPQGTQAFFNFFTVTIDGVDVGGVGAQKFGRTAFLVQQIENCPNEIRRPF